MQGLEPSRINTHICLAKSARHQAASDLKGLGKAKWGYLHIHNRQHLVWREQGVRRVGGGTPRSRSSWEQLGPLQGSAWLGVPARRKAGVVGKLGWARQRLRNSQPPRQRRAKNG